MNNSFTYHNAREQIACLLNRALTSVLSPTDPLETVASHVAEAEKLIKLQQVDESHER